MTKSNTVNFRKVAISLMALVLLISTAAAQDLRSSVRESEFGTKRSNAGTVAPTEANMVPVLTITPITWGVVGLDSNNVTVGPNLFPVGARVCNTGATAATNVASTFVWDSANALINLRTGWTRR